MVPFTFDGDRHHAVEPDQFRETVGRDVVPVRIDEIEFGPAALVFHDRLVFLHRRKGRVVSDRAVRECESGRACDAFAEIFVLEDLRGQEEVPHLDRGQWRIVRACDRSRGNAAPQQRRGPAQSFDDA